MTYYSTIKMNEVLIYAITWMNPENSIINEITQTKRDK
jgi:hypothetical protein